MDRHCFGQPRSLGRERLKVTRDKLRADYSLLASVAQKEVRPAPAFSAPDRVRGAHVRGAWRKTGSGLTVVFIGCSSAREFASEHCGREVARSLAGAWALSPEAANCLGRHLVLRRSFGDLCSPLPFIRRLRCALLNVCGLTQIWAAHCFVRVRFLSSRAASDSRSFEPLLRLSWER